MEAKVDDQGVDKLHFIQKSISQVCTFDLGLYVVLCIYLPRALFGALFCFSSSTAAHLSPGATWHTDFSSVLLLPPHLWLFLPTFTRLDMHNHS